MLTLFALFTISSLIYLGGFAFGYWWRGEVEKDRRRRIAESRRVGPRLALERGPASRVLTDGRVNSSTACERSSPRSKRASPARGSAPRAAASAALVGLGLAKNPSW
jgi:hypothetical protein